MIQPIRTNVPAPVGPSCGLRGTCAGCPSARSCGVSGLGLSLPSLSDINFADWRVMAAIAAGAFLLFMLLGKHKDNKRKKLSLARLKYAEEAARIRRS